MKKILLFLLALLLITGCDEVVTESTLKEEGFENPVVTMTIEGYGDIVMELYPEYALNTVSNFVNLVEQGFFKDNAITRVQKGFVIQAGGLKSLDYSIKGEFASNGYTKNTLSHTEGVISMARGTAKDSALGQFFIMLADATYLDGDYAAFGKVIEGMDIVKQIEKGNYDYADSSFYFLKYDEYIKITDAKVDTKGYTYKVQKLKY